MAPPLLLSLSSSSSNTYTLTTTQTTSEKLPGFAVIQRYVTQELAPERSRGILLELILFLFAIRNLHSRTTVDRTGKLLRHPGLLKTWKHHCLTEFFHTEGHTNFMFYCKMV